MDPIRTCKIPCRLYFKMDGHKCLRSLLSEVEGAFVNKCDYIGKVMDYNGCGRQSHCPPTKWMSMFDRLGKWNICLVFMVFKIVC